MLGNVGWGWLGNCFCVVLGLFVVGVCVGFGVVGFCFFW